MINRLNKRPFPLIITGLFAMIVSQIIAHYFEIPDTVYGLIMGIALGLMILGLLKINTKSKTSD